MTIGTAAATSNGSISLFPNVTGAVDTPRAFRLQVFVTVLSTNRIV